jgi:hypothetical protein
MGRLLFVDACSAKLAMRIPPATRAAKTSKKGDVTNQGRKYQTRGAVVLQIKFGACQQVAARSKKKGYANM